MRRYHLQEGWKYPHRNSRCLRPDSKEEIRSHTSMQLTNWMAKPFGPFDSLVMLLCWTEVSMSGWSSLHAIALLHRIFQGPYVTPLCL